MYDEEVTVVWRKLNMILLADICMLPLFAHC